MSWPLKERKVMAFQLSVNFIGECITLKGMEKNQTFDINMSTNYKYHECQNWPHNVCRSWSIKEYTFDPHKATDYGVNSKLVKSSTNVNGRLAKLFENKDHYNYGLPNCAQNPKFLKRVWVRITDPSQVAAFTLFWDIHIIQVNFNSGLIYLINNIFWYISNFFNRSKMIGWLSDNKNSCETW